MNRSDKRRRFFLVAGLVALAIGFVLALRWLGKKLSQSNSQKGFSLLEMLLGVFGIALIGALIVML